MSSVHFQALFLWPLEQNGPHYTPCRSLRPFTSCLSQHNVYKEQVSQPLMLEIWCLAAFNRTDNNSYYIYIYITVMLFFFLFFFHIELKEVFITLRDIYIHDFKSTFPRSVFSWFLAPVVFFHGEINGKPACSLFSFTFNNPKSKTRCVNVVFFFFLTILLVFLKRFGRAKVYPSFFLFFFSNTDCIPTNCR